MSVLLKGGTVVTTTGRYAADVYVENGKIKSIGTNLDKKADEVVACKGKYILPGTIDPHTHIAMPFMGTYSQDDFETGGIAAACGGVTCLVDFAMQMKGDSLLDAIDRQKAIADGKACIDYSMHPAVTDPRPEVIEEVKKACLQSGWMTAS
jgi:dihydropyrimidinase